MSKYEYLVKEAQNEGIRRCVVGAVLEVDSKVLLLWRPETDFMGGICELPSGKVEEGETLVAALEREVEEETSLRIAKIKSYLGHFDYESRSGTRTRQFNFLVVVLEPFKVELQEHVSYAWISIADMDEYPVTDSVRQVICKLS